MSADPSYAESTGTQKAIYDRKGRRIGAPPPEPPSVDLGAFDGEARRKAPRLQRSLIMAHPLRRAVLAVFAKDRGLRASAKDLSEREDLPALDNCLINGRLSNIDYHCNCLKDAGLLEVVEVQLIRGAVKSILGLTEKGHEFLDGEGSLAGPESVLDQMAALVRLRGSDAYPELVELLASTGRGAIEAN